MGACLGCVDDAIPQTVASPTIVPCVLQRIVRSCLCREAFVRLRSHAVERHGRRHARLLDETSHVLRDLQRTPGVRLMLQMVAKDATIRRLTRMTEEQDRMRLCCVCVHNPSCVLYAPCHHVCVCERCDPRMTHRCPICRVQIEDRARVYFS